MKLLSRSGWILTGGRSSRMGTDKALLFAKDIANRIAPVCGHVTLVGDPAKYASLGIPIIPDNFPGEGPLAGIEAALQATHSDLNLIVACDMPALEAEILESLFLTEADCTIPRHTDGKSEPLCAVYHRRCHPLILAALEAGERRVTRALPPETLRYVQVANAAPFANLNTPDDLRKYNHG